LHMQGAHDAPTTGVLARARLRLLAYLSGRSEGPMSSRCDGSYGQRVVSHFGPPARGSRTSTGDVRCRLLLVSARWLTRMFVSEDAARKHRQRLATRDDQGVWVDTCPESIATHRVRWLLDVAHGVKRLSTIRARHALFVSFSSQLLTKMGGFPCWASPRRPRRATSKCSTPAHP